MQTNILFLLYFLLPQVPAFGEIPNLVPTCLTPNQGEYTFSINNNLTTAQVVTYNLLGCYAGPLNPPPPGYHPQAWSEFATAVTAAMSHCEGLSGHFSVPAGYEPSPNWNSYQVPPGIVRTPYGLPVFAITKTAQSIEFTSQSFKCHMPVQTCIAPNYQCPGGCVNRNTDPNNCGTCGNVCSGGKICTNGACVCAVGTTWCAGVNRCVMLNMDPANCGNCGNSCASLGFYAICNNGQCGCSSGYSICPNSTGGSSCVNKTTDNRNCGTCGTVCPAGRTCMAGMCGAMPGM